MDKDYGKEGADVVTMASDHVSSTTDALKVISYAHHEIHGGSAYAAHAIDSDYDKSDEINICFATPNTTKWLHCVAIAASSIFAEFKICEGATVTATTGTDALARNRNRNESDESVIVSTKDGSAYKFTYGGTVTNDGTIIHTEMMGSSKQGAGTGGSRDVAEYILKANTVYAFRMKGNGVSGDNGVGSMEITWYEHTDR